MLLKDIYFKRLNNVFRMLDIQVCIIYLAEKYYNISGKLPVTVNNIF